MSYSNSNMFSDKVKKILPYLLGTIFIFYIVKPSISFKPSGQLRNYGFGYDSDGYKKTLYTMHNIIILLTVLFYIYMT
jgi:hypothetical protein